MKKVALILAVLMMFALPAPVYADVVFGNDFAYQHENELTQLDRSAYIVNSPEGYIIAQLEPGQSEVVAGEQYESTIGPPQAGAELMRFENGELIYLSRYYLYRGNEYWGVTPVSHSSSYAVWVPMDEVMVAYTGDDWYEAHQDACFEVSSNQTQYFEESEVALWSWPGSSREKTILETKDLDIVLEHTYADSEGRSWGYVRADLMYRFSYYGWVCLDDPSNKTDIPAFFPEPDPQPWEPYVTYEWTINSEGKPEPSITPLERSADNLLSEVSAHLILLAVVVVTAILAVVVVRRQRRKS